MSALPSFTEPALMTSLRAAFAAQDTPTPAQKQAWSAFNQFGLPGLRDEHWKYTQLHKLYAQHFVATEKAASLPAIVNGENALVIVNGQLSSPLPVLHGLKITQSIDESFAGKQSFIALNAALNANHVVIEVDDSVVIEQPLTLDFISAGEHAAIISSRITLKLGRNSKLTLLERHRSISDIGGFNNIVMNIVLNENAQLQHCRIQRENSASFNIANIMATLGKHASYINHQYNLGGLLSRIDINVQLQGKDAYVELNGLQFAINSQVHDTHSRVEHCVPYARSNETYHGIADQRGQVIFNGKVLVHKHAIGTDAQQSSRNLLLSPKAEIDTKPELEIYADDVKCAHGATVGQLDNTALFYLRSRGIGEQEARALLTLAFADAVISKIPVAALREELTQQVHARFDTTKGSAS